MEKFCDILAVQTENLKNYLDGFWLQSVHSSPITLLHAEQPPTTAHVFCNIHYLLQSPAPHNSSAQFCSIIFTVLIAVHQHGVAWSLNNPCI
jgi:hypothetical protein